MDRPRYQVGKDERFIYRDFDRLRPAYEGHQMAIVLRERERERPRFRYEEEIFIRGDRSRVRSRYREANGDKQRGYGPLVLRDGRARPKPLVIINNQGSKKIHVLSSQPKTPTMPMRSAAQRSFADVGTHIESTRPFYRKSPHTIDSEPTDEDIITSTLKRFTTFNADAEDELPTSAPGWDSPTLQGTTVSLSTMDLTSAQRKLEELLRKEEKATAAGDLMAASDLHFYAIPDVRALVEELKAQQVRKEAPKKLVEVEEVEKDAEQVSAAGVEDKMDDGNVVDLQPRIIEYEDSDVDANDFAAWKNSRKRDESEVSDISCEMVLHVFLKPTTGLVPLMTMCKRRSQMGRLTEKGS